MTFAELRTGQTFVTPGCLDRLVKCNAAYAAAETNSNVRTRIDDDAEVTVVPTPIVVDEADSQIVLYAKGHFRKVVDGNDVVGDVKVLLALRAGLHPQDGVSDETLVGVLTGLTTYIGKQHEMAERTFFNKLIFGFAYGSMPYEAPTTPVERFTQAILDIMGHARVQDDNYGVVLKLERRTDDAVKALVTARKARCLRGLGFAVGRTDRAGWGSVTTTQAIHAAVAAHGDHDYVVCRPLGGGYALTSNDYDDMVNRAYDENKVGENAQASA